MELKSIVDALVTGGFADLLLLSLVGCLKKCAYRLFHKISIIETYISFIQQNIQKEAKIWVIPKNIEVEGKLALKKRRARKRNKRK